ncbi:MAG: MFS transporter [Acidobacteria bacterium]|nr:MFS transporter [Acidobacteriota bacterium]
MRFLTRRLGIQDHEATAVAWSWLFFFSVLSSYYVLRPIRDDMGVESGVANLPWLFTGSLVGMLVANPPFAWIAARLPRRVFVSAAYRFFALNLAIFFLTLRLLPTDQQLWAARAFFVWTSIFNMFVVSIFWSVMADVYSADQGKRLFGLIGAAGTIGSLTGAALTSLLVEPLGAANLLLLSAVLLEAAALAARRLFGFAARARDGAARLPASSQAIGVGGSVWEGMRRTFTSAYFLNITTHMLLFTVLTTFLYFQQATLVDAAITDRAARTRFFANIDLLVNLLALVTQTFATGWFIRAFGLTAALLFLPVLSLVGFGVLGLAQTTGVLMLFQVLRRAGNFAVNRPAREVLFTVAAPEDRYKTKAFIDTVVYRAGDQIGAWAYAPLAAIGFGIAGISSVALGLSIVSIVNAWWLGWRWQAAARDAAASAATPAVPTPRHYPAS